MIEVLKFLEIRRARAALGVACVLLLVVGPSHIDPQQLTAAVGGTIVGHVRVGGTPPGNPILRMGMDPGCVTATGGKRLPDQIVVVTPDGSLANAFAKLEGNFPAAPVPAQPVVIDQRACMYTPRVVGARVGQVLEVRNSDSLLHNVHSATAGDNAFNFAQPIAGGSNSVKLKAEEMLHLTCDVHRWMHAYVGVVSHPYFAVSDTGGGFRIEHVPAGSYRLRLWHERLGVMTQTVKVTDGGTTRVDLVYASKSQ